MSQLLPHHREHLRAGGLTDATIAAAGLFSVTGDGAGLGLPAGLTGIAFPYPGTEVRIGGRRLALHRLRVDEACRRSPDRKYESPPKARLEDALPFHVYVPPGVADLRKRTVAAVWITEGEKKALVLTQHGRPCLGLPGVFLFTDPRDDAPHEARRLHPDLRRWHWRDRVVFVCFDADRLDNEQVALAHERLSTRLAAEGARVRVVTVPDGPGVDDHLVTRGTQALEALADAAQPWLPEAWRVERLAPDAPPAVAWAQLDAMRPMTRRLDPATLEALVARAKARRPDLDPARVARALGLRVSGDLHEIVVNGRQQRDVIDDAWDALLAAEHGEALFLFAGRLVRLHRPRPGDARVEAVSADLLTALLRRSASWLRDKDGEARVDAPVPREVALDMLALPSEAVPAVDRLLRTPALGPGGALWRTDGHHPAHRAFLDPPACLHDLPPMPLAEAVGWLRDELLVDFPFVAEVDRTHAVAALVLPFVRPAIDGPTPLHLVEAPTEGTGKSLLADVLVRVATGRAAQPTTLPRGDDATRKKITALLADAPAAVVLDNLAGLVDSPSLAAALTATTWADRRLGETQMLAGSLGCPRGRASEPPDLRGRSAGDDGVRDLLGVALLVLRGEQGGSGAGEGATAASGERARLRVVVGAGGRHSRRRGHVPGVGPPQGVGDAASARTEGGPPAGLRDDAHARAHAARPPARPRGPAARPRCGRRAEPPHRNRPHGGVDAPGGPGGRGPDGGLRLPERARRDGHAVPVRAGRAVGGGAWPDGGLRHAGAGARRRRAAQRPRPAVHRPRRGRPGDTLGPGADVRARGASDRQRGGRADHPDDEGRVPVAGRLRGRSRRAARPRPLASRVQP